MPMQRKIGVFINEKAGRGKSKVVARLVKEELIKHHLEHELYTTHWPEKPEGLTDAFVVGGDGTLNFFINKYPYCQWPITLIRAGSGNDFHKEFFGRKIDFKKNIEAGIQGEIVECDAGNCNGKWFVNGFGAGFDGQVVKSMSDRKIKTFGFLAYLLYVLKNILFYRSASYRLTANGIDKTANAFMVTVANGKKYGGGFAVAPMAVMNDGKLNLVIIKKINILLRLIHLPKLRTGSHTKLSFVENSTIEKIFIQCRKPMPAHTDGEYFSSHEFNIEVHPKKFRFRIPGERGE